MTIVFTVILAVIPNSRHVSTCTSRNSWNPNQDMELYSSNRLITKGILSCKNLWKASTINPHLGGVGAWIGHRTTWGPGILMLCSSCCPKIRMKKLDENGQPKTTWKDQLNDPRFWLCSGWDYLWPPGTSNCMALSAPGSSKSFYKKTQICGIRILTLNFEQDELRKFILSSIKGIGWVTIQFDKNLSHSFNPNPNLWSDDHIAE